VARARAEIIACETCGGAPLDEGGRTRGAQLIELLRLQAASRLERVEGPDGGTVAAERAIQVSSTRCLWACKKSCAVMLRSPGRVGYVLVELEPIASSARALLDYADLYLRSEDGAVPYRSWPQELKGHFHCRTPRQTGAGDSTEHSICSPGDRAGDEDLTA
jgi:predicted metal-binding protein